MSALVALANAGMMQMGGQQNMMMNMMQGGMNMVPMGKWRMPAGEWLNAWTELKLCEWPERMDRVKAV